MLLLGAGRRPGLSGRLIFGANVCVEIEGKNISAIYLFLPEPNKL
jgi:hypothetical protein